MLDYWLTWGLASALMAGIGLWLSWTTLSKPRAPRRAQLVEVDKARARYENAHLLLPWGKYLTNSAVLGALFAVGGYLAVLNPVVILPLFAFGFVFVYCGEEDRRDRFTMQYNNDLAQAASAMINSFEASPSIDGAIEITSHYAPGAVALDFAALSSSRKANVSRKEALAAIAEQRNSLFLDGFFETIKAADKMNPGDIVAILKAQNTIILEGVESFNRHIITTKTVREEINLAIVLPWVIAALARWMPVLAASASGITPTADVGDFYVSPVGTVFLLMAALVSLYAYWTMSHTIRSGIVLGRIKPRRRPAGRTQPKP